VTQSALYIHAGVRSRSDCQSVAELVAAGWTVEYVNRWGGALCRLELNAPAHATGHAVRDEPPIRPDEPGMRRKEDDLDGRSRSSSRLGDEPLVRRDRAPDLPLRTSGVAPRLGLAGVVAPFLAVALLSGSMMAIAAWEWLLNDVAHDGIEMSR
jgi:hypothetical protein